MIPRTGAEVSDERGQAHCCVKPKGVRDTLLARPALAVEIGAAAILAAALAARLMANRYGVPSIVTLLIAGLIAGPSGFNFIRVDLGDPSVRGLLALCVVVVLFEVTLRIDLRNVPKRTIAILAILGAALPLLIIPWLTRRFDFPVALGLMLASICVVTGPTVIGPLVRRLALRPAVGQLLETEGLLLDAVGVVLASAMFAYVTSQTGSGAHVALQVALTLAPGILTGMACGFVGRVIARRDMPDDILKLAVLFLGIGAFAVSEWLAPRSGLAAVVACGLSIDLRQGVRERAVLAFKEDLAMLALSAVFVLMASQIELARMTPLLGQGAAITGALIAVRLVSVVAGTAGSSYAWSERALMAGFFPRGIVAVSLAMYYGAQLPFWHIPGGRRLSALVFIVVVFTVTLSSLSTIGGDALLRRRPSREAPATQASRTQTV